MVSNGKSVEPNNRRVSPGTDKKSRRKKLITYIRMHMTIDMKVTMHLIFPEPRAPTSSKLHCTLKQCRPAVICHQPTLNIVVGTPLMSAAGQDAESFVTSRRLWRAPSTSGTTTSCVFTQGCIFLWPFRSRERCTVTDPLHAEEDLSDML